MKQLANIVTVSRAPLGIAIALLIQNPSVTILWVCIGLAVLAEITDFADGTIARKLNAVSSIGKALDPLCDSLYRLSVFVGMTMAGWISLPLLFIFLFRDIIVAYARIFAAQNGVDIAARLSGKLKAIIQAVAQIAMLIAALLTAQNLNVDYSMYATILMYIAALVTFISGIDYAYHLTRVPKAKT